jgi:hypothetical protein
MIRVSEPGGASSVQAHGFLRAALSVASLLCKESASMSNRPMETILDVTSDFTSPGISWTLRGKAFYAEFPAHIQRLRAGLYVLLVGNDSPLPICDRNGAGKVIVPANGGA